MEEEKKNSFHSELKAKAKEWNKEWSLKEKWKFYKRALTNCKHRNIKKIEIKLSNKNEKDVKQHRLYKELCYIGFLRRNL